MEPIILLLVIAAAPVVLALVLRVSSLCVFAAIAAGALLVQYIGDDTGLAVNTFARSASPQYVLLAMLFIPVVLTLLLARKSLPKSKMFLHLVPIITNGALLAALALPLLPGSTQHGITQEPIGKVARQSSNVAIGIAVGFNLALMWYVNRVHHKDGRKHHR